MENQTCYYHVIIIFGRSAGDTVVQAGNDDNPSGFYILNVLHFKGIHALSALSYYESSQGLFYLFILERCDCPAFRQMAVMCD